MYSVNGVPLDNPTLGWRLMRPTKPLSDLTMERPSVRTPGRHGVVAGIPATFTAPVLTFAVLTPLSGLEALDALWTQANRISYTARTDRDVDVEVLSLAHTIYGPQMEKVQVEATVRIPDAFWRDWVESTTAALTLGSGNVTLNLYQGISAPVQDAIVRVKGGCSGLRVTDGAGSWFSYAPALTTAQWLRFDADAGQAWITTTNSWTGGTDVSGSLDFGGPNGSFEITPQFTDPQTRLASLTVVTSARSGAQIEVRGRAAYLL